jgi:4,5-dihydroxyphthalate decarboxylase
LKLTAPLILKTALGKHAHVAPLKDGRVTSKRVTLVFHEFEPLPDAFRTMVRGGDLDVSEMAVVTHLLAHRFGKPITGIAIPLWSRLPHVNLVCAPESDITGPKSLEGRLLGVRAYAQTSGVWVRGILQNDYGVDLGSIRWLTMEDAHLTEYDDPGFCMRNAGGKGLRQLMLDGELAAIMGERVVDPGGIRTVIPDAEGAAHDWIERNGHGAINHILSVKSDLLRQHDWLAAELSRMFNEAREIAIGEGAEAPPDYGVEACRASLQMCLDFSAEQQITQRRYFVDEMFVV